MSYISMTFFLTDDPLRSYNKIESLYLYAGRLGGRTRKEDGQLPQLPNIAMKQRLILCLVILMTLLLGLTGAQAADLDNLKIAVELSADKLAEPKEITVSIQVTNSGETDMPGPMTLYYPNGKQVEEFGSPTLTAGSSKSWSGPWQVTQSQLENGKLTFKLKYSLLNEAGEIINKTVNFSKAIEYTGAVTNVEINRTITPTIARKGQEVTVTYDVINAGNVDITDVVIKEHKNISTKQGKIDVVPAGEKASYSFTATMGTKDLTSQATITYKASGKTQTDKKAAATIKYGQVKLSADLKADKKGGAAGDTVKLTLTLKNSGTVDYQNISVTDPTLGEVFAGQAITAGKTVTLEKDIVIANTADYQFTVKGQDATGTDVETATERVTITAVDPSQVVVLAVEATADREVVYQLPGTVKFKVKVTNTSAVEATDVDVYASGVYLYNFPTILPGETREFTRDVHVSMAGQYRFDAHVTNQLNETDVFESNVLRIAHELPTAVPTDAPIITPPKPVYDQMPATDGLPAYVSTLQNVLSIASKVFMVLGGICLALLAIGVVRRIQSNLQSAKAQDHLERGAYRDYTQPAAKAKKDKKDKTEQEPVTRPIGEDKDAPAVPEADEASAEYAEDGELMAETLKKLYPRGENKTAEALTVEVEGEDDADIAPEAPVTGRHRRSQKDAE